MALVRWRDRGELSPWSAFRDLESQFSRMLGDWTSESGLVASGWTPAVDLRETEDGYMVDVDVPGMKKEDIELAVVDNVVTIKGERKDESQTEKDGYRRSERRYGTFQRSFEVPGGFDSAKVEARYEDGVLRVTLPKREESKPKQIEVKVK
jgi:HSP20 family protein